MAELVPLRIKITRELTPNGLRNKFPDLNTIDAALRGNADWTVFIDQFGGMHTDKESPVGIHDPANDSPVGTQLALILVPAAFATAAVAAFPTDVTQLTNAQAEAFYQDRAHKMDPAIFEDPEALRAIVDKGVLGISQGSDDTAALDPDHSAAGRRRNPDKAWANFKSRRDITVRG